MNVIDNSLSDLLRFNGKKLTAKERLEYILNIGIKEFSRKDYMDIFKNISSSTASRDLKRGVDEELLKVNGQKNKTKYTLHNKR